jgi:hypothetical protein
MHDLGAVVGQGVGQADGVPEFVQQEPAGGPRGVQHHHAPVDDQRRLAGRGMSRQVGRAAHPGVSAVRRTPGDDQVGVGRVVVRSAAGDHAGSAQVPERQAGGPRDPGDGGPHLGERARGSAGRVDAVSDRLARVPACDQVVPTAQAEESEGGAVTGGLRGARLPDQRHAERGDQWLW